MSGSRHRWFRALAVLALVLVISYAHARFDLTDRARLRELRVALAGSGLIGIAAITAGMSFAILLYFPAWPFIGLAVAVYGRLSGGLISLGAAVVAVCVSFLVVRAVGGTPLRTAPWSVVQKLLLQLESAPVRTVFLLRTITGLNAIVNYSLALSRVTFLEYLVGSAAGLVAPVAIQVWVLAVVLE